jgi:O-antigen/teichoic acid export membrane protein
MASMLRDFGATFGSRMVVMVIGLATQSCLAWFLEPSGRGAYAVCLVFAALLSLVFMLGSDVACIYYVASKKFSLSQGVVQALVSGAMGSALAVAAGLVILQLPLEFRDKADRASFYLALVSIPIAFYAATFYSLFVAVGAFGSMAAVSLVTATCHLALVLVLVPGLCLGVNGALGATIVGNLLTIVIVLAVFRRRHGLAWVNPTVAGIWDTLRYGIRYYVGKVSNEVNFQMGTIVLSLFATKEAIGLFDTAAQLTSRVLTIPDSLATVLIPRVAGDAKGRPEQVAQCSRIMLLVCGVPLVLLLVLAPWVVPILFSPKFAPSVPLIQILVGGVLVRCASKIFAMYLTCTNRPGIASVATAAGMVVNLGLLVGLMPVIGLAGAAVAMTGNYLISSAILTAAFHRASRMGLREAWRPRRSDWAELGRLWRRVRGRPATAGPGDP